MDQDRWSLFKCQRCGQCCEKLGLPWYGDNIERMAEFLKMNPENLVTRYYGEIGVENGERAVKLDRNRTTPCQFLGEDKSCQVYPVRPDGCKAYPIQTDFGRFGINCPAMKILDAMDYPEEEEENQPLDRICLLFEDPETGWLPHPYAYICVGSWSSPKILGYEQIALSAECTSYDEVKWWVGQLKQHLDNVQKEAKRKFAHIKERSALR